MSVFPEIFTLFMSRLRLSKFVIHLSGLPWTLLSLLFTKLFFKFMHDGTVFGWYLFTNLSHANLKFTSGWSDVTQLSTKLNAIFPELVGQLIDSKISWNHLHHSFWLFLYSFSVGKGSFSSIRALYPFFFMHARTFLPPNLEIHSVEFNDFNTLYLRCHFRFFSYPLTIFSSCVPELSIQVSIFPKLISVSFNWSSLHHNLISVSFCRSSLHLFFVRK